MARGSMDEARQTNLEEAQEESGEKKGLFGRFKKKNINETTNVDNSFAHDNQGSGKSRRGLVLVLVIVVAIGALFATYYFNFFGVKDTVVNFFISQDDQYRQAIHAKEQYEQKDEAQNEKQLELSKKEKELTEKEIQLQNREEKLREDEQSAMEEQMQEIPGGTNSIQSDGTSEELKPKIVEVYEGMKVEDAAEILNATTDNTWIAELLYKMDEKKAAKIVAALDIEKAVVITRLISELNS